MNVHSFPTRISLKLSVLFVWITRRTRDSVSDKSYLNYNSENQNDVNKLPDCQSVAVCLASSSRERSRRGKSSVYLSGGM
jgi:hypothetical protein